MAYIDQQRKSQIAPEVKRICQKYGVKGSLRIRDHSTLVLTVQSGPIDFITNCNEVCSADHYQRARGFRAITSGYMDINPYHIRSHHSGAALDFLTEVLDAMNAGNWDHSDIQTDYFNVGWYVNINIGTWKKPYKVVDTMPEHCYTA